MFGGVESHLYKALAFVLSIRTQHPLMEYGSILSTPIIHNCSSHVIYLGLLEQANCLMNTQPQDHKLV